MNTKAARNGKGKSKAPKDFWKLRLYIAGETSRSLAALENLQKICDEHLTVRTAC